MTDVLTRTTSSPAIGDAFKRVAEALRAMTYGGSPQSIEAEFKKLEQIADDLQKHFQDQEQRIQALEDGVLSLVEVAGVDITLPDPATTTTTETAASDAGVAPLQVIDSTTDLPLGGTPVVSAPASPAAADPAEPLIAAIEPTLEAPAATDMPAAG